MAKQTDITAADAPAAPTVESLALENAALKQQLADLTVAKAVRDADEKIIAAKCAMGLSRQQAIAVIRRQREYDATSMGRARLDFGAQPDGPNRKTTMQLFTKYEAERIKREKAA